MGKNVYSATKVVKAAALGDLATVKRALAAGFDAKSTAGSTLTTALHGSAKGGHRAVANALLDAGADPNREDKSGQVPLAVATRGEMVKLLCRRGADVNHVNREGQPLISLLFEPEAVKALLACGAEVDRSWDWMFDTIGQEYFSLTKLVQITEFSLFTPGLHRHQCRNRETAVQIIKLLLAAGADPNHSYSQRSASKPLAPLVKNTALDHATVFNFEATELLLKAGADPGLVGGGWHEFGERLLAFFPKSSKLLVRYELYDPRIELLAKAVFAEDRDKIRRFIDDGVNPNKTATTKLPKLGSLQRPLCIAVQIGSHESVAELLDLGADPNMHDRRGFAPLHHAIENQDVQSARILLEGGADPNLHTSSRPSKHSRELVYDDSTGLKKILLAHGCELYPLGPPDHTMVFLGSIKATAAPSDIRRMIAAKNQLKRVRTCKVINSFTGEVMELARKGTTNLCVVVNKKPRGTLVVGPDEIEVYGEQKDLLPLAKRIASQLKARFRSEDSVIGAEAIEAYDQLVG